MTTALQQAAQEIVAKYTINSTAIPIRMLVALRKALADEKAQASDKSRLDWLDQNIFNRENLDMFGKVCKDSNMWVMFAPRGVQGSARAIIDSAMLAAAQGAKP